MKNVGLVGLGDHAMRSHLEPLLAVENVVVTGAFDPSDDAFAMATANHGIILQRYATYDEMLADKSIDAVLIASPDRFHLPQLQAGIKAGKHVFCEKPLCNDESELAVLSETFALAEKQGLILTSCHPRRFDPPYVWLKENIADLQDRFGKPMELKLDFTYHKPSEDKGHLHGGSMLQDHMNHEIDYLNFVFGHQPFTATKLVDTHDRYQVAGIRDDDLAFTFGGTRRLNTRSYAESVHVRFERGDVHIDTYSPQRSYLYDHHNAKQPYELVNGISTTDYTKRFSDINRNWVEAMHGLTQNYLTVEDMIVNSTLSVAFQKADQVRYPRPLIA